MKPTLDHTVELQGLRFGWQPDNALLTIDRLQIRRGERLFIHGPSGSGKSTLLSLLGGLILPQAGDIRILGKSLTAMRSSARDRFRADHLGFIFQQFNLIPYLDAVENITLGMNFSALRHRNLGDTPANQAARELLQALELDPKRIAQLPARKLSIGQQQRVAVARALIGSPELIIADEPTSSLDSDSQARFMERLLEQCQSQNSTLIFVSHDLRLADHFDRRLSLAEINSVQPAPEVLQC